MKKEGQNLKSRISNNNSKKFLKNENWIFSFFKFWNMSLNFTFHFFEIKILISILVSSKIETKFEFKEINCDVKVLLVDVCTVLRLILFITSTLNHGSWANKMDCVGK